MSIHNMKRSYRSFDFLLMALVIAMAVFGVIIIGSATHITLGGDIPEFYRVQKIWVLTGVIIMLFAAFIDYHFICRFYIPIYITGLVLLIAVLFLGSGDSTGTARWIRFGSFSLQPSEFCKIFMIIFLAQYFEKHTEIVNRPYMVLLIIALVILPVLLIIRQPSLSAAMIAGVTAASVLFMGRISYKYIAPVLLLGIPLLLWAYTDISREDPAVIDRLLNDYQLQRIMLWIAPDESDPKYFQTMQSINALGSGSYSGKGLYNGEVTVPYAHNDFIFSVIGEELGFKGCMAVLGVMLLIVLKCLLTAYMAVDISGRLIAGGAGVMLAFQTFVHVGVATGALPNTGAPLPFISYGGSSMWVCMAAVGLCINVGMTKSKSLFED